MTTSVKTVKKNKNINTPVALAIDNKELEKVPSVTRGRLSIVQINQSLVELKQLVIEKHKTLSSTKKTVQTKAFVDEVITHSLTRSVTYPLIYLLSIIN